MNYEDFYQDLQPQEKNVKDGLASMQKLFKAVVREIDGGDVKSLIRDLEAMAQAVSAMSETIDTMKTAANGFDAKAYFESGELRSRCLQHVRKKVWMSAGKHQFMKCFHTA